MDEGGRGTSGQTSPLSTDQTDINDGYVTANRTGRAAIAASVYYYVAGLSWQRCAVCPVVDNDLVGWGGTAMRTGFLYFLANDPSVPEATRNSALEYGLCADSMPYWPAGVCTFIT